MEMKNCINCGIQIDDDAAYCPKCGKGSSQAPAPKNPGDKISNALKVFITAVICYVPAAGALGAIIAGCVLMSSPLQDNRSFGKSILILGIVLVGLYIICCIAWAVLGSIGMLSAVSMYEIFDGYYW